MKKTEADTVNCIICATLLKHDASVIELSHFDWEKELCLEILLRDKPYLIELIPNDN